MIWFIVFNVALYSLCLSVSKPSDRTDNIMVLSGTLTVLAAATWWLLSVSNSVDAQIYPIRLTLALSAVVFTICVTYKFDHRTTAH